ncbi:MAG: DUF429 domain-containing protein [Gammaproteobacteria bacterium]|nr:DUF429 domain-containing protein [Gammaproteobacteria bacterium]
MIIAGSDRSKAGWLTLVLVNDQLKAHLFADFSKLLRALPALDVLVADVPVGLPEKYPRQCDKLARQAIKPRHNSVFMTPLRQVLDSASHAEANAKHRQLSGVGLSQQAYHILPVIREIDAAIQAGSISTDVLHEGHPEVSFWAANEHKGILDYKKTPVGHYFRRRLLEREFCSDHFPAIRKQFPLKRQAADDDILDALAMLWTAQRIATGSAQRIPTAPERDKTGIDMAIWY